MDTVNLGTFTKAAALNLSGSYTAGNAQFWGYDVTATTSGETDHFSSNVFSWTELVYSYSFKLNTSATATKPYTLDLTVKSTTSGSSTAYGLAVIDVDTNRYYEASGSTLDISLAKLSRTWNDDTYIVAVLAGPISAGSSGSFSVTGSVPLPGGFVLLASGLIAAGVWGRRRRLAA